MGGHGTTAVVTGAAGRLGRLLCAEFARRGHPVAAIVRSLPDAAVLGGIARVHPVSCDLADERAVTGTFARIADEVGPIAHFVHAAGAWDMAPLLDTSLDAWRYLVDVNLTTAFLALREATRQTLAAGGGHLVAIAARQGVDAGAAAQGAYSAAKGGLVRLVEAVAAEHGHEGIVARVVAPSMVLFEGMSGDGVQADVLAARCVDLALPGDPAPNGSVIRLYGSAG